MNKEEKEKIKQIECAMTDINNAKLDYGNAVINIKSLEDFIKAHIRVDSLKNISDELDIYRRNFNNRIQTLENIRQNLDANIRNIENLAKERDKNVDK